MSLRKVAVKKKKIVFSYVLSLPAKVAIYLNILENRVTIWNFISFLK